MLSIWTRVKLLSSGNGLTAKVISWWCDANLFPGFLTPVLAELFFPKPQTTFLTCFCRGERQTYARKIKLPQPGIELTTTRS